MIKIVLQRKTSEINSVEREFEISLHKEIFIEENLSIFSIEKWGKDNIIQYIGIVEKMNKAGNKIVIFLNYGNWKQNLFLFFNYSNFEFREEEYLNEISENILNIIIVKKDINEAIKEFESLTNEDQTKTLLFLILKLHLDIQDIIKINLSLNSRIINNKQIFKKLLISFFS